MAPATPPLLSTDTGSATDDELITGEAVALQVRPAGIVPRALGGVIDTAVIGAALVVFSLLIDELSAHLDRAATQALYLVAVVLALLVLPVTVEVATRGRSLGRWAVGARIVRDDGGATGIRQAFVRALTGCVEVFATAGGLAIVVALLNPRAKRIGDYLAGTYAQRERVPKIPLGSPPLPPQLVAWAQTADVAALPDPLARRISAYLAQHAHIAEGSRTALATSLAREATPFVHPLPDVDPVVFLYGVSAVRRERERRALDAEARRLAALTPTLVRRPNGFPPREPPARDARRALRLRPRTPRR